MQTLVLNHHDQSNPLVKREVPEFWWLKSGSDEDIWYLRQDEHSSSSAFTVNWVPKTFGIEMPDLGRWTQWREYAQKLGF